ncbi:unnamed protein product [Lathyrus oleraceus]|uniref:Nodule-specific cysteine-rich peptide G49 n=1 Tax=Pisum sativum TaxID=3888 RepID=A0A7T8DV69_PEA|nr:nodule-specific cysteine-rich peptide G49 [Pisum sativum]
MVKILKFVYAIFLFFSPFLLLVDADKSLQCETDEDCPIELTIPKMLSAIYKCFDKECIMFREVQQSP